MRQTTRLESRGPLENPALTGESLLEGEDDGVFVFSPQDGRILGRARTGTFRGTMTLRGGPQPLVMEQTYRYENTITAVSRTP